MIDATGDERSAIIALRQIERPKLPTTHNWIGGGIRENRRLAG